jgi:DnaA family protein
VTSNWQTSWLTGPGGQLPLDLSIRVHSTYDNLLAGGNSEAISAVQELVTGSNHPNHRQLLLHGPPGSGKSHLLQAACHHATSHGLQSQWLDLVEVVSWPEGALDGLEQLDLLALDRLESLSGKPKAELLLFNLFNRCRDRGCNLLIASRLPPSELSFKLKDLHSRLQWGACYTIRPLDDNGLQQLLQLQASARGIRLDPEVASYILRKEQRDPERLLNLLGLIERATLAAGRRVTIPFVRQLLSG